MRSLGWGWLGVLLISCTVEDVIVDTGSVDTGDPLPRDPGERPDVEDPPADDPPVDDEVPEEWALLMEPSAIDHGATTLVFLTSSDGTGLDDVVAVDLYGEPDVDLQTFTVDGPGRMILSLEVPSTSPLGEVVVVLEHADGDVSRPEAALAVR